MRKTNDIVPGIQCIVGIELRQPYNYYKYSSLPSSLDLQECMHIGALWPPYVYNICKRSLITAISLCAYRASTNGVSKLLIIL